MFFFRQIDLKRLFDDRGRSAYSVIPKTRNGYSASRTCPDKIKARRWPADPQAKESSWHKHNTHSFIIYQLHLDTHLFCTLFLWFIQGSRCQHCTYKTKKELWRKYCSVHLRTPSPCGVTIMQWTTKIFKIIQFGWQWPWFIFPGTDLSKCLLYWW